MLFLIHYFKGYCSKTRTGSGMILRVNSVWTMKFRFPKLQTR